MKKKLLAVVPVVALLAAPFPNQVAEATSVSEQVQDSIKTIPAEFDALLSWAPEEQPIVTQGSQSYEVEFIQTMLVHFGYETDVDGVFGSDTAKQLKAFQGEKELEQDAVVGVNTWTVLLEEYRAKSFQPERAVTFAEHTLDNDDLIFSSDGILHEDEAGKTFYSLKAQSKDLIDGGGSGTVGYYNVYSSGEVEESNPI